MRRNSGENDVVEYYAPGKGECHYNRSDDGTADNGKDRRI